MFTALPRRRILRPMISYSDNQQERRRTWFLGFETLVGAIFALTLVLGAVSQVGAGGPDDDDDDDDDHKRDRTTQISGDALPIDCSDGEGLGGLTMTGDVDGCLIFLTVDGVCQELNGFALWNESGTERFVGTVFGEDGTFNTTYTLEATYLQGSCDAINTALAGNGDFPYDKQLTGGCDHRIKGKTGAFKRAKGLITFHDVIPEAGVSGASNFFWSGDIRLKK